MGTQRVPAKYLHVCDGCAAEIGQESAGRPPHWSELTLAQDAYDFQGSAVADATIKRLLCRKCTALVSSAINQAIEGEAR